MIVIYMTGTVLALIATAFVVFFVVLFRRTAASLPGVEWLRGFSLEKYRALDRLFSSADLEFAAGQRGYTRALGRKLASSRRDVARLYLSELTRDFDGLVRIGREMVATSRMDRSDLASQLLRQWMAFHVHVIGLRVRLRLVPLGLPMRRPEGLLEALVRLRGVVAVLDMPAAAQ